MKRERPVNPPPAAPRLQRTPPDQIRLQKFLAECGVGSRRKTETMITEGRVQVNGTVVTELGTKIDPRVDSVEVNRRPVRAVPKGIMLLNKPRGVVSTLEDPEGRPTISDFLTKHYRSYFPVGRLDWDSTGLMILTNDGDLAELLMHPRYEFDRVYEARVEGSLPETLLPKIEAGIKLSDGVVKAVVRILRNDEKTTWVEVRVREGRNRVVRRLFEKLEHAVIKLKRISYGPFKIGSLQVGQMRVMTQREYEEVRFKVFKHAGEEKAPLEKQEQERGAESRKRGKRSKPRTRWTGE